MARGFRDEPLLRDAYRALDAIEQGATGDSVETRTLDCKEEPGRRDKQGNWVSRGPRDKTTAEFIADEACCMANSEGGVLIVGIADKPGGPDAFIGAESDAEWLRERVWALSEPHLGVEVLEHPQLGQRLLLVVVHRSYRLHRSGKKYRHRVGTGCQEMSVEDQRLAEEDRTNYDWSAEVSGATLADVSPGAVEVARRLLNQTQESSRQTLAERPTPDLLRALGVLDSEGRLNNAGRLLFVDEPRVLIDYRRRHVPGGPSVDRVELSGPLIDAYVQVKQRLDAVNEEREMQLPSGARPRIRLIPDRAVRESLVNALAHRDYRSLQPVDVEFVDMSLVVVSPGGFPTGITPDNIIVEPSHPRNNQLLKVFQSLRLAEREGQGVDRMYRDMVSAGHELPTFSDNGGRVRCHLAGGEPSQPVFELMSLLPEKSQDDVDVALILDALQERATVAPEELTYTLQKPEAEALVALRRGVASGVLVESSSSTRTRPRFRLADNARDVLRARLPYLTNTAAEAEEFVVRHLLTQQSIKPDDVVDLLGLNSVASASRILRQLRESEVLQFGSQQTKGRGVFHVRGPAFDAALQRHGLLPASSTVSHQ